MTDSSTVYGLLTCIPKQRT